MAFVRSDKNQNASNAVTITTGGAYAAGTSVIVVVAFRPASNTTLSNYTVSDSVNGAYNQDVISFGTNNGGIAIFSKHNIASTPSSSTITVTMSSTGNKTAAIAMNFSGLETTSTLDKTQVNPAHTVASPSGATYTSNATDTTTQATELLVGGVLLHFDTVGDLTPTAGWDEESNGIATTGGSAGSNAWGYAQYEEVSATGAYTSNPTGSTRNFRSAIATYKLAAPASSTHGESYFMVT